MFASIEPINDKQRVLINILKVLSLITLLVGLFRWTDSGWPTTLIYLASVVIYVFSWRGLWFYGCLLNQCLHVVVICGLLQGVRLWLVRWQ